jgi:hypothetical protein
VEIGLDVPYRLEVETDLFVNVMEIKQLRKKDPVQLDHQVGLSDRLDLSGPTNTLSKAPRI